MILSAILQQIHAPPLKTAHAGLGISTADWDTAVKLLTQTLDKFKVAEKEKGEVMSAISALHTQM